MQSRQLGGDQIDGISDISKSIRSRNWELRRIVEAWIKEVSFAMHVNIGNKRIPVRYRTPTRPGVEVNACQTERGREQRGTWHILTCHNAIGHLFGVKCLAIQNQFGIELSRSP